MATSIVVYIFNISLKFPLELSLPRYALWLAPFVHSTGLKLGPGPETGRNRKQQDLETNLFLWLNKSWLANTRILILSNILHKEKQKLIFFYLNLDFNFHDIKDQHSYLLITNYHHEPHHHQYQGRERILMILISHKRPATEALKDLTTSVILIINTIIINNMNNWTSLPGQGKGLDDPHCWQKTGNEGARGFHWRETPSFRHRNRPSQESTRLVPSGVGDIFLQGNNLQPKRAWIQWKHGNQRYEIFQSC